MTRTRREFLQGAAGGAALLLARCGQAPFAPRPDLADPGQTWIRSVCRFCGTGCGVRLHLKQGRVVAARGDPDHPATKGLLCAKGLFLPKVLHADGRLIRPLVRRGGALVETDWETAMELLADRLATAVRDHGPGAVGWYGSGQCLSEESYLAARLFKGGIGSDNVESSARLGSASALEAYVETYGSDAPLGCFDDIEKAKVLFVAGSNLAECHPVLFDAILLARKRDPSVKLVVVDPRRTPTAAAADLHLAPAPGADLAVYHALAHVIVKEKLHDAQFLANKVAFRDADGAPAEFEDYAAFLEAFSPANVPERSGVPAGDLVRAARMFAAGPTVSLWGMGLNQRTRGVWANQLVHTLHLLTGLVGRPGSTPLGLTGQPNGLGGSRDAGALRGLLPCGRRIENPGDRAAMERLWGSRPGAIPESPGLDTLAMFRAFARGDHKALLVTTTNPAASLPDLDALWKARSRGSFLCVVDAFATATTEQADLVLPAAIWSEKEGVYGTSERRYQFLPKLVEPPGEARPDLDLLLDLAARLEKRGVVPEGFVTARLRGAGDVWEEMRLASRGTTHDFSGMTRERLRGGHGLRWPCPAPDHPGTARRYVKGEDPLLDAGPFRDDSLIEGEVGFYARPDGRALIRMRPAEGPFEMPDAAYPFVLVTGRVLEHWNSATLTGRVSQLARAHPEPLVEMHPEDAQRLGLEPADEVRIASRRGATTVRLAWSERVRPGTLFLAWHDLPVNLLTGAAVDEVSRQPEYKVCAVRVEQA